ncbi:HlyD family secretion protein [Roseibium aggregatum]|uniref:HlyD family secretion protein n=1 Tax=Roseibium aggregatum TaxID=187304 RepID=UPI002E282FD6|nr:HlyD family secretion protein [Roseibium aggregatum]
MPRTEKQTDSDAIERGAEAVVNQDQGDPGTTSAAASGVSVRNSASSGDKPLSKQETVKTPAVRSDQNAGAPEQKKGSKAKRIFMLVLLAGLGFGGYEAYHWWTVGRFFETTDDAYVKSDITVILSKVSGYVSSVEVRDNQHVKAGDVLIRIDDGDYKLAVKSAQDSIGSAEATVARIKTQIEAAKTSVLQAEASVASAEAGNDEAQANYTRQKKLADNKFVSQATLDTAEASLKQAQADLKSARVAVKLAKADVEVLIGQKKEAEQAIVAARTALEQAKRDLQFTVLRAPVDGIVGNRAAQVGSLLQAGSRIAAIVPLADTHIDANFKETQLEGIHPGAEVAISVDAYPDQPIKGTVESISPATGSVFSLLPSENATGNFTKVVQRVPVKIKVPEEEIASGHLRAGMSVVVEVDTRTGGGDSGHLTKAAMR